VHDRLADQQEPHGLRPEKAAITPRGRGAKKLFGILNSPFARPIGRSVVSGRGSGRISAMGSFRLQRRIVSPRWSRSR
jgi:hypothetical protein